MSTKSEQERKKMKKFGLLDSIADSSIDSLVVRVRDNDGFKTGEQTDEEAYPTVEEWLAMPDNEKLNVIHDSLLELYLNVKIRNFNKTIDSQKVDEELDKLKNVETLTLVDYIKSCVEIIMNMKLEESQDKINEIVKQRIKDLHNIGEYDLSKSPEEYEKIIQKLEAEVRNHISVQQQMKLYIESYQSKMEELEPIEDSVKKLENEVDSLKRQNKRYEKDIDRYKQEISNKQKEFETKMSEIEKEHSEKVDILENRAREMHNRLSKYQSLSKQEFSSKNFHKKNEASVDVPESQK